MEKKKMKKAGIIGFGNIGKKLYEELLENGWAITFIVTSEHVFVGNLDTPRDKSKNWLKYCQNSDIVFLTIPTLDGGKIALDYIAAVVLAKQIPVVTCEKGALSNYFADLQPILSRIGYSATVGGGSGIIHFLKRRFFPGMGEVHAIVNSTMNYIWDDLKMGNPLGHVVEEVKRLGYAEPGENDSIKIILGEANLDVPKKISILFNFCFNSKIILQARNINMVMTQEMVRQAISEAANRRFVVSFVRGENFKENKSDISSFTHYIDGWVITGGFKKIDTNPLVMRLCNTVTRVNNAVLTLEGKDGVGGVYLCLGPGAGSLPVATAMIRDAEVLLED